VALIKIDTVTAELARNEQGFCVRWSTDEVGEAIGRITDDGLHPGSRFEGYTDKEAAETKILRNAFVPGRCLVSQRRPDAERRARLFLFR